jgi:TonB family protein
MKKLFILFILLSAFIKAQVNIEPNPETPPVNYGGKPQLEQILRTQQYIAGPYIETPDKEVSIYFTVTKTGKVQDSFFKEEYSNFYKDEIKRLLRFCVFEPAKKSSHTVDAYGSLSILFSGKNYKTYLKDRKKTKLNLDDKKADTTFTIYEIADKSPEFYKGDDALPQFIFDNIEYPNVAKTQNIEGTVNLSFIVEANGFVTNVKALKTVGGGCTDEAIRVADLIRWKPAEKDGKYVRYKMNYPITFSLKNVNRDASNSTGQ